MTDCLTHCCCTRTCESMCTKITYADVDRAVRKAEYTLELYAQNDKNVLYWGYPRKYDYNDKIALIEYTEALKRQRAILYNTGGFCICESSVQSIIESTLDIAKPFEIVYEGQKNSEAEKAWLLSNPYCASREAWEALTYEVCGGLNIHLNAEDITPQCNITFSLATEDLCFEILYAVSVAQTVCDLNIELKRTDNECRYDWKILVEELDNCFLDYKSYVKLVRECGYTYDIVRHIYECGGSLEFSSQESLCPILKTSVFSYDTCKDLKFSGVATPLSLVCPSDSACNTECLESYLNDLNITLQEFKNKVN